MVRKLSSEGDWCFGRNKADYIRKDPEIQQNIKTRLRSFKDDWFLDVEANIPWIELLGSFNKKREIEQEVKRVILATDGVLRINRLDIIVDNRVARIEANIDTVYSQNINLITEV